MKYREYTIKTTTAAEDLVADILNELDLEGVEIVDNVPVSKEDKEKMIIDVDIELPPDDGTATVKFYLNADASKEEIESTLKSINEGLDELRDFMDIGEGIIVEKDVNDEDWINNWKKYFKSFYIDDIFIRPSWEEEPKVKDYNVSVIIDPKTSFGTGHHETTMLCIKGMRKVIKEGDDVLDIGTGSGILSIIANKFNAKHTLGIDIDPICEETFYENMEVNGIEKSKYEYITGDMISDGALRDRVGYEKYDVCLANILSDVIIPMAPYAFKATKKNGFFVTSGIIDFKEEEVSKALEDIRFMIVEKIHQGEWVGIICRK